MCIRDSETIMALQEEVDAFDQHQQLMEQTIDQKISTAMQLKQQLRELGVATDEQVNGIDISDAAIEARSALADVAGSNVSERVGGDGPADQQRVQALQSKLEETKRQKAHLEATLRESLERMVNTELEERISKVCRAERDNGTVGTNQALQELSKMKSNTPEFQQRLASIVAAKSGTADSVALSTVEDLKDALTRQGEIMRLVSEEPTKQALEKVLTQVTQAEQHGQGSESGQQQQQHAEMVQAHTKRKQTLLSQIQQKEVELKKALQESRRLMGAASGPSSMPLRNIQQNIAMIEKETELVSSSYEQKVSALQEEIELDEKRAAAEQKTQNEELLKYKQQAENDAKERKAIKTILDVKIMALVENVQRMCEQNNLIRPSVNHDIVTLKKLVRVSVEALE
eukprot:TRINITY_DN4369_c0_g1_i2.p1 TRINITY_DN4369_c0_g1~~TRINITY_DN4369_c0_g1_i2.p1  ORF type:complete len:401 (-),score=175.24 TRINITY_DN4369_c0_g1_i2:82-1284(-)